MLKLDHFIANGIYYVVEKDEEKGYEKILMSVELLKYPFVQVSTEDSVFTGPIELLKIE